MLRKCQEVSRAGFVEACLDVDHGRRAEHRPGELLGPRPLKADRLAGRLCQPGGLDGAFARVLAPEPAAEVRDDHPDAVVGQAKRPRELAAHAERLLARRPDGQLAVLPLGDRRAWLHRAVLDVGDMIGLAKRPGRPGEFVGEGILRHASARVLPQSTRRARHSRDGALPPTGRSWRSPRGPARREGSWERRRRQNRCPGRRPRPPSPSRGRGRPTRASRRTRAAEDLAVEHPRPADVRGVPNASPSRRRGRWAAGPRCQGPSTGQPA